MTITTELAQELREAAIAASLDGRTDDAWFHYLGCVKPANVLALLDALAESQAKNALVAGGIESALKLQERAVAAEQRIAELEARTEQQPFGYVSEKCANAQGMIKSATWELFRKPTSFGPLEFNVPLYIAPPAPAPVTVKLPALHVGVVQGGHAVMVPYAAGHWFNKTAILEMLAAAGIKIAEGE